MKEYMYLDLEDLKPEDIITNLNILAGDSWEPLFPLRPTYTIWHEYDSGYEGRYPSSSIATDNIILLQRVKS